MTAHARAFRAKHILPITAAPIEGGVVEIVAGRISHVGARPKDAGQVEDLGDVVILPGLVNTHTHLEFSGLAAPLGEPGAAFPAWIRAVVDYRRGRTESVDASIRRGMSESVSSGVAAVGEIATVAEMQIYDDAPLGVTAFCEAIGLATERIAPVLADVERRVSERKASSGWNVGISPHAPYTVHPELFARLMELGRKHNLPVAFHLAESREELQHLRDGEGPFYDMLSAVPGFWEDVIPRGTRPLDYLRMLGEAPRALVIHGNYLDVEEIMLLSERRDRLSVVYCPRTHAYFGHDKHPLRALLSAGVTVALGTDSRASNPDLSVLAEMRQVAKSFPDLAPATIFELGTLAGARALGVEQGFGSLAVGKRAELAVVPLERAADPLESVLYSRAAISPLTNRDV